MARAKRAAHPIRCAPKSGYRLRVGHRIITSGVLFLDSVPVAPFLRSLSSRRPSANVRPILCSLLCCAPPLNLVNASKMLRGSLVMETQCGDGPPMLANTAKSRTADERNDACLIPLYETGRDRLTRSPYNSGFETYEYVFVNQTRPSGFEWS